MPFIAARSHQGMYLDFQQPRMLPRDENGFVADIHDPSCNCFNEARLQISGLHSVTL